MFLSLNDHFSYLLELLKSNLLEITFQLNNTFLLLEPSPNCYRFTHASFHKR